MEYFPDSYLVAPKSIQTLFEHDNAPLVLQILPWLLPSLVNPSSPPSLRPPSFLPSFSFPSCFLTMTGADGYKIPIALRWQWTPHSNQDVAQTITLMPQLTCSHRYFQNINLTLKLSNMQFHLWKNVGAEGPVTFCRDTICLHHQNVGAGGSML